MPISLRRRNQQVRPAQSGPKLGRPQAKLVRTTNVGGVPGGVKKPKMPRLPAVPTGGATAPAPKVQYTPGMNLPPSFAGNTQRTAGREAYGLSVGNVNELLRQALMNYGGDSDVAQFSADDDNFQGSWRAAGENPNSALAQIGRSYTEGLKTVGDQHTGDNTFFSGLHNVDRGRLGDERVRATAQAQAEFQAAVREYIGALLEARADRNRTTGEASITDLEALQGSDVAPGPVGDIPRPIGFEDSISYPSDKRTAAEVFAAAQKQGFGIDTRGRYIMVGGKKKYVDKWGRPL